MNSDQVERALFSLTGSVEAVRETTISGATVHGISVQQSQQQAKANLSTPNTVNSSNEQSTTTK